MITLRRITAALASAAILSLTISAREANASEAEEAQTNPSGATLYVAADGRDSWSGKLFKPNQTLTDGPLASLEKAVDVSRSQRASRTILMRGGDYYLRNTIEFDSRDRGLVLRSAPGETPVLHGGIPVNGWLRDGDGHWFASVLLGAGQQVGDLFIGGVKQVKARHPNLLPGGGVRGGWLFAAAPAPDLGEWQGNTHFRFHPGDIPLLKNTSGLTARIVGGANPGSQWGSDTLPVLSIDYRSGTVSTRGTSYFFTGLGSRYFLEGRHEFMDASNEWWYDGTAGVLHYISEEHDFSGQQVVAGVLPTLIHLNDADDMTISGLTFKDGSPEGSGKFGTDTRGFGGVRLERSDRVRLLANTFTNLGVGIHVSESNDVVIAANSIGNIAGNGIYLGTTYGSFLPSDRAEIVGNIIQDVSQVYFEGAGIWFQATRNTIVAHNQIENSAQFGIHGGSIWGAQDACYDNRIEYNVVRNANRQTADGGAIKLMGEQADRQNSVIRYNLVTGTDQLMNRPSGTFWPPRYENTAEWPTPISWAIYLDGKASGITIEGNLVLENVSGIGINGGWNNVVIGNIIAKGTGAAFRIDDATGRSWRPAWAQPNQITGNIIVKEEGVRTTHVYAPGHAARFIAFSNNLYQGPLNGQSFEMSPAIMPGGRLGSLADFQRAGQETGSVMAEPQFRDLAAGDFTLRPSSPAYELGFKTIAFARIGLSGFNRCRYGLC